jgi:hypothetical protein
MVGLSLSGRTMSCSRRHQLCLPPTRRLSLCIAVAWTTSDGKLTSEAIVFGDLFLKTHLATCERQIFSSRIVISGDVSKIVTGQIHFERP